MATPHVSIVCHTASRTGAPLVLLHMLPFFKQQPWLFDVQLYAGGALLSEFEKESMVKRIRAPHPQLEEATSVVHRAVGALLPHKKPDLYFLHSHTFQHLHRAKAEGVPVIHYVHEIPLSFEQVDSKTKQLFCTYPLQYLVASDFIAEFLVENVGVPAEKIQIVRAGFHTSKWQANSEMRRVMRARFSIPEQAVVVTGSGQITPIKGTDLWLQAAKHITEQLPDRECHFVWIGGRSSGWALYQQIMEGDARRFGLADKVHFVGEHDNPQPFYNMADVFMMSSRSESLSLVCLEHTLLDVPSVVFSGSKGPDEMVRAGFVRSVEDLNPKAMATEIIRLITHPEEARKLTQIGQKIIPQKYDILISATGCISAINHALTPHAVA